MKALYLILTAGVMMTACTTNPKYSTEPMVGMANPASEYCVSVGGKLEAKKDSEGGEYALCHLPDGRVVEEWALYRSTYE